MKLFKKITSLFVKKEQMFVKPNKIEEVEPKRELRMSEEDGNLKIFYGDNLIINNTERTPFIEVIRGNFEIKEGKVIRQFRKIIPIYKVKAEKIRNFIKLEFADKGYRINVIIKEGDEKLEINLEGKENYEYINCNFNLSANENLYGLGELDVDNLIGKNILNYPNFNKKRFLDSFKRDNNIKKSLNTSNILYSDKGYLLNVDSAYSTEFSFNKNIRLSFNKRPYRIEFYFDKDVDALFKRLNGNGRNRQKLLTRYIKGIVVQENVKKLDKTLSKATHDGIDVNSVIIREINLLDEPQLKKAKEIAAKFNVNLILKVTPEYDQEKFLIEKFKDNIDKLNEYANGYYLVLKESMIKNSSDIADIKRILLEKTVNLDNKILLSDCNVSCETLDYLVITNDVESLSSFKNMLLSDSLGGFGITTPIIEKQSFLKYGKDIIKLSEIFTLLPLTIIGDYSVIAKNVAKIKELIAIKEALRPYYIKTINNINKGGLSFLTSDFYGIENANKVFLSDVIEIDCESSRVRVKKDNAWVDFPQES